MKHITLIGFLSGILLSACAVVPQTSNTQAPITTVENNQSVDVNSPTTPLPEYLSPPPEVVKVEEIIIEPTELEKAASLIEIWQFTPAAQTLNNLNFSALTAGEQSFYNLLKVKLAFAAGNIELAEQLISSHSAGGLNNAPDSKVGNKVKAGWQGIRADLLQAKGQKLLALRLRLSLDTSMSGEMALENQKVILQILATIPAKTINEQLQLGLSNHEQAWYELALVLLQSQANVQGQITKLNRWKRKWATHSVAKNLDKLFVTFGNTRFNQSIAGNIAVLLPLSGNFSAIGKAIQQGLIGQAEYFAKSSGKRSPKWIFYDTVAGKNVIELYQQAMADGVDWIVGPLLKSNTDTLANYLQNTQTNPRIKTLLLNQLTINLEAPLKDLYQFSLSIEDEVAALSQKAWRAGCHRALVLNNSDAFNQKATILWQEYWRLLGGQIVNHQTLTSTSSYSQVVRDLLQVSNDQVDLAKEYFNRDLTEEEQLQFDELTTLKGEPDCAFLFVGSEQSLIVRPLFSFYLANDLNVLGLSRLYNLGNIDQNKDLERVYIADAPWLIGGDAGLKQKLQQNPEYIAHWQRLHAFGIDIVPLIHFLPLLQNLGLTLEGASGKLSVDNEGIVHRAPYLMQVIKSGLKDAERVILESK